jgi:hypothetical protein
MDVTLFRKVLCILIASYTTPSRTKEMWLSLRVSRNSIETQVQLLTLIFGTFDLYQKGCPTILHVPGPGQSPPYTQFFVEAGVPTRLVLFADFCVDFSRIPLSLTNEGYAFSCTQIFKLFYLVQAGVLEEQMFKRTHR